MTSNITQKVLGAVFLVLGGVYSYFGFTDHQVTFPEFMPLLVLVVFGLGVMYVVTQ